MLQKRKEILNSLKPPSKFKTEILKRFLHFEYNKKYQDLIIYDFDWIAYAFFTKQKPNSNLLDIFILIVRFLCKYGRPQNVKASFGSTITLSCKDALPDYDEKILYYLLRFRESFPQPRNPEVLYIDCVPQNEFIYKSEPIEQKLINYIASLCPASIDFPYVDDIYNMVKNKQVDENVQVTPMDFFKMNPAKYRTYHIREKILRYSLKNHLRPKTWY